jgi:TPR repeat protein
MLSVLPAHQLSLKPNLFSSFGRLPTRVIVVCHVALPNRLIAWKVVASRASGTSKTSLVSRAKVLGLAKFQESKDVVMSSRAFLSYTLIPLFWFSAFASVTTGHLGTVPVGIGQNVTPETPSLIEKAQAGDAKAEYQIGWSYCTGKGVPVNYREAAKWLRRSATQGFPDAQFALGYLYEHGNGLKKNHREAVLYYTAAAKQGHSTAENNLASMYQHGQGVRKNLHEAAVWYQRAADHGEVIAQCNLASMYFRGEGLARDYSQAANWFRSAAERGYAPAQENLAWMYYTGTGLPLDYSEAARWARAAAEQGLARAQLDLGYLYEQGKGVPLDYVAAYMWYKSASNGGQRQATGLLKGLSAIMSNEQIKRAIAESAKLPRSRSPIQEGMTSETIGSSFVHER